MARSSSSVSFAFGVMNKKAYFLSFGFFVMGLMLGAGVTWGIATLHYGKIAARGLPTAEKARLMETAQRTTDAYRNETSPVKIYALRQYLITLEKAERIPENPVSLNKRSVAFLTLDTHGRLAKLYAASGETNLSAQHVAAALICARELNSRTITNQVALEEWVAKLDEMVEKAQRRYGE